MLDLACLIGLEPGNEEPRAGVRLPTPAARTAPFTFRTDVDPTDWVTLERHYGIPTSFDVQVFADGPSTLRFAQPVRFNGHAGALVRFWGEPPVPGHIEALLWALREHREEAAELLYDLIGSLDAAVREYDTSEQKE